MNTRPSSEFDLGQMWATVLEVAQDPASNSAVALLLLAAVAILVLMVLVVGIMFIMGTDDDEDEESAAAYGGRAESGPAQRGRRAWVPQLPWAVAALLWAVAFAAVWVAGGAVTARDSMCVACHPTTVHSRVEKRDPHADVQCVACHEQGGRAGALTYMVPARAAHFIEGLEASTTALARVSPTYGLPTASSACMECHAAEISRTLVLEPQGVKMSHAEPLAAGAACPDCHRPVSGIVSSVTVGMRPCLRCHDGKQASSDCASCHTKDVGLAVRASTIAPHTGAREIIETPDCGGCHSQATCDACHGVRLPHTRQFREWAHAREGAKDLWFNDGKTCARCHHEGRRPCRDCHEPMPAHGGRSWANAHQGTSPDSCSCHDSKAVVVGRNICELCHSAGTGVRK
jgi:hypothetical protein